MHHPDLRAHPRQALQPICPTPRLGVLANATWRRLLSLGALAAALSGCGTTASDGGAGTPAVTAGDPCYLVPGSEQCGFGGGFSSRLQCSGGVWIQLEACAPPSYCAPVAGGTQCAVGGRGAQDAKAGDDVSGAEQDVEPSEDVGVHKDSVTFDDAVVDTINASSDGSDADSGITEIGIDSNGVETDAVNSDVDVPEVQDVEQDVAEVDQDVPDTVDPDVSPAPDAGELDVYNPDSCIARCGIYKFGANCQCHEFCVDDQSCCTDYSTLCSGGGSIDADAGTVSDTDGDGQTCTQQCDGKQCGPDGCGGACGSCPSGYSCNAGTGKCESGTTGGTDADAGETDGDGGAPDVPDTGFDIGCQQVDPGLQPGALVITEIMINPKAVFDDFGEWIEIYNPGDKPVPIGGMEIVVPKNNKAHKIAGCTLFVAPKGYLVLGASANKAQNGGVEVDYVYDSVTLANYDGAISLRVGSTVIDVVAWSAALWPPPADFDGKAASLDPNKLDAVQNDTYASTWCPAKNLMKSGDFGTPGQPNPECAKPLDPNNGGTTTNCPTAVIVPQGGKEIVPQSVLGLVGAQSFAGPNQKLAKWQWKVAKMPTGAEANHKFWPSPNAPDVTFGAKTKSVDFSGQEIEVISVNIAGEYIFELVVIDDAGNPSCTKAVQTIQVIPDGDIHVELVWTTPGDKDKDDIGLGAGADLDLHFAHSKAWAAKLCQIPAELCANGKPCVCLEDLDKDGKVDPFFHPTYDCFWFNSNPNWSSNPAIPSNPSLELDDTDGWGPESLSLKLAENEMEYTVGVHYWDAHSYGASVATVRIFIKGVLMGEYVSQSMNQCDLWWVKKIAWPSGKLLDIEAGKVNGKVTPKYKPIFSKTLGAKCSG